MLNIADTGNVDRFSERPAKKIFIFLLGLAVLFFLVKFIAPLSVSLLYDNGNIDFLNLLSGGEGVRALDYYHGRMGNLFFGPASSVIAGIILVLLCGKVFIKLNLWAYALAVFLYLLFTKFEVLFFPAYGDAVGGPFAEAIWLLRNNFNYAGLAQQPGFIHGGPRVYLFTIYPGYLAALMRLIPNVKMFLAVNHLLVFAYAGVIVAFFRESMMRLMGRDTATLVSALLLSLPLFQGQAEAINMEIPTLLFSMVAIYYLISKDFKRAALFSVCASLIKAYAVYVCVTIFFSGILAFFWDRQRRRRKRVLFWSVASGAFFIAKFLVDTFAFQVDGKVDFIGLFEGWPMLKGMPATYIYSLCVLVFLVFLVAQWRKESGPRIVNIFNRYYVEIVFFICSGVWFGLFLNSYAVLPRYQLHLMPFFMACLFIIFKIFIKDERFIRYALCAAIFLACLFSYGVPWGKERVLASSFEASLEYRNDLKLHMGIAKRLEEQYASFTIAAPFTIAQILALPELGYVKKPLNVIIYGYPCTYGGIRNFRGLPHMQLSQTIWVGLTEPPRWSLPYPVGPQDRIIEEIEIGNRRGVLFLGGFAIERLRQVFLHLSRIGELRSTYDGRAITIHEGEE